KGLIGPNGAGKTTAFNAITGVYPPTSGNVLVTGQKVNGRPPHQINRLGVARTFQNIRLFKDLTAIDNVRVALLAKTKPIFSEERIRRARANGRRWQPQLFEEINNYWDWWRALLLTPG